EPIKSYKNGLDLAQALFGYTEKEDALKGRVIFGHAFADESTIEELNEKEVILGGPKASYFPFYLTQFQKNGKYFTYDNSNAAVRGFKRSPVKEKEGTSVIGGNNRVTSTFKALAK